jgi:uncharacterized protein YegJ (DUF2314 family)
MSDVILNVKNDEKMNEAQLRARKTFKYFWREMSWEARRIIPGLGMSAVKMAFKTNVPGDNVPQYEHMWIGEIEFDGNEISGALLNNPSWISDVVSGDRVRFTVNELTDWLYAINGRAFGGFTVNAIRYSMSKSDRKKHDDAWGLEFGNPEQILIVPAVSNKKTFLQKINPSNNNEGYTENDLIPEHPMSENMLAKMESALIESPEPFLKPNEFGSTMLHFESLAGNLLHVKLLLKYGADKNLKNSNGQTPLQLAKLMEWEKIVQSLD